jgi:hypothetical protein
MKYTKRLSVPIALLACTLAYQGAQAQGPAPSQTSCTAFAATPTRDSGATYQGSRAATFLAAFDQRRDGVQAVWVFRLSQEEGQVFVLAPGFMCNLGIHPWRAITMAIDKGNLGADL